MLGEIKNSQGERIDYTFHSSEVKGTTRLVVLGHGVTGNKDRSFLVTLANTLAQAGISALRISFSGNGNSDGLFVDSNITKEVADLGAVLDRLDGYQVGYVGHSMGGAVGVVRTSRDPRIRFLVSLAGMVHTREFAEREFGQVTPDAGLMWNDPACPLSSAYMTDLRNLNSLTEYGAQIRVPWLLVHGTEDDVVPIQDSRDIFARANEPKQLLELPGANHVFAGERADKMVTQVAEWIIKVG